MSMNHVDAEVLNELLNEVLNKANVIGIGTDILDQNRIVKIASDPEKADRFARRILTLDELYLWEQRERSINFLAKRFAAKEAISKALGTGIAKGISFQHFNISSDEEGKPEVTLYSAALQRAEYLGGSKVLLSLSDEGDMILAFALLT